MSTGLFSIYRYCLLISKHGILIALSFSKHLKLLSGIDYEKIITLLVVWTCFATAPALAQQEAPIQTYVHGIELAKVIQILRQEALTKVISCPLRDDQIDLITASIVGFLVDKVEMTRGRTPDKQLVHITYRPEGIQGFSCTIDKKSKLFITTKKP